MPLGCIAGNSISSYGCLRGGAVIVLQPERFVASAAVRWVVVAAAAVAVAESTPVPVRVAAGAAVEEGEVRRVAVLWRLRVRSARVEPPMLASSASSCAQKGGCEI